MNLKISGMNIQFTPAKHKGSRGIGLVERWYGWRILLWWWDIAIDTSAEVVTK